MASTCRYVLYAGRGGRRLGQARTLARAKTKAFKVMQRAPRSTNPSPHPYVEVRQECQGTKRKLGVDRLIYYCEHRGSAFRCSKIAPRRGKKAGGRLKGCGCSA